MQEYIVNSYEMLIKIYAIGDKYDIVFKPTLPKEWILKRLESDGFVQIGQKTNFEGYTFDAVK